MSNTTAAAGGVYPVAVEGRLDPQLSRWQWLVKWWLLAVPHYLIVAVITGGALSVTFDAQQGWQIASGGLIGVLVLVAAVGLLFTNRYPRGLYDLIMGLQRWVDRVVAYAALMTDQYPPFRLDMGGREPTPSRSSPHRARVPARGAVRSPTPDGRGRRRRPATGSAQGPLRAVTSAPTRSVSRWAPGRTAR